MFDLFNIVPTKAELAELDKLNQEIKQLENKDLNTTSSNNNNNNNNNKVDTANNNILSSKSQAIKDKFKSNIDLDNNNNNNNNTLSLSIIEVLKPKFYAIGYIESNNNKLELGKKAQDILVKACTEIPELLQYLANGKYETPISMKFHTVESYKTTKKGLVTFNTIRYDVITAIYTSIKTIYINKSYLSNNNIKILPSQIELNNDRHCGFKGTKPTKYKISTQTVKASSIQNIDIKFLQKQSREFKIDEYKPDAKFRVKINNIGKIILCEIDNTGYKELGYIAEITDITIQDNHTDKGIQSTVIFQWKYHRSPSKPVSFWSRFNTLTDNINKLLNGSKRDDSFINTLRKIIRDNNIKAEIKEELSPDDIKDNNRHKDKVKIPTLASGRKQASKACKKAKQSRVKSSGF